MRTLLAIHQKPREPSFWEAMESFVLLAYENLAYLKNLLQQLLACLNLNIDLEDLLCWCKQKKFFQCIMWAAEQEAETIW